jgi:hypothetical protein
MPSRFLAAAPVLSGLTVPCLLAAAPVRTVAQGAERQPAAVTAGISVTWAAVRRFVRDDPNNGRLDVLEEGAGMRHGRWQIEIPTSDFRAGEWASCRAGADAAYGPRQGVVDVVIRGDSTASTIVVSARWSAQDPSQPQTASTCVTQGKYEQDAEKAVRTRAEREAKRRG